MLRIVPLAQMPSCANELREWFESEWPDYYGPGGPGNAAADLSTFAQTDRLPLALVALRGDELCGMAALKAEAFADLHPLSPWASAGLVKPALRRSGIGAQLLAALEVQARSLGFARIYCATSTANSLLRRNGWQLLRIVAKDGTEVAVFDKAI